MIFKKITLELNLENAIKINDKDNKSNIKVEKELSRSDRCNGTSWKLVPIILSAGINKASYNLTQIYQFR